MSNATYEPLAKDEYFWEITVDPLGAFAYFLKWHLDTVKGDTIDLL